MTEEDRQQMQDSFVRAAEAAMEGGFDCVEIHCGYGYLLSQYLSPRSNPVVPLD